MAESNLQDKIGDGLNQLQGAVSDAIIQADQKLGVTDRIKKVADHELVKETTSKVLIGVSHLGDLIVKADEKFGVSERVRQADEKFGVSEKVRVVSERTGADKAVEKVDNLLGIQQRYDAFIAAFKSDNEEEVQSSHEAPKQNMIVPPRMMRVESDPTENEKVVSSDSIRLVSTGWAGGFQLNLDHLCHEVTELFESVKGVADFDLTRLTKLFDDTEISDEQLDLWCGYGDSGKVFSNKNQARSRLATLVTYCNGTKCTQNAKQKLKFIAAELIGKPEEYDPVGILLLLASHGNVCNVMKEVGVDMAYSSITSQNQTLYKSQSLSERMFKLLYEFRIMLVEELYATFPGAVNNTHSIGLVRNFLAKDIGISTVLDEHGGVWGLPNNWQDGLLEKYFRDHYNVEKITRWIFLALNEEPRKIPYDLLMKWLENNSPIEEKYLFFSDTFNVEAGIFKTRYVCWLLMSLGVFKGPEIKWEVWDSDKNVDAEAAASGKDKESLSFSDRFDQVGRYSAATFNNLFSKGVQQMRNIFIDPQTVQEDIEIHLDEKEQSKDVLSSKNES